MPSEGYSEVDALTKEQNGSLACPTESAKPVISTGYFSSIQFIYQMECFLYFARSKKSSVIYICHLEKKEKSHQLDVNSHKDQNPL